MAARKITFYQRFEADILAGKKTITIRDENEKDYQVNSIVKVSTYETDRWFCDIKILDVAPIQLNQLSEVHAQQENMSLPELKSVIKEIYPKVDDLYVISFELV